MAWTEERRAILLTMYAGGVTYAAIGKRLSLSASAIKGRLDREQANGNLTRRTAILRTPMWTMQRQTELAELMERGFTTSAAARAMGLTKNQVIGALSRNRWISRDSSRANGYKAPYAAVEPNRLGGGCRWIESDPITDPAWTFCGAELTRNIAGLPSSYCAEHHRRVWVRPT